MQLIRISIKKLYLAKQDFHFALIFFKYVAHIFHDNKIHFFFAFLLERTRKLSDILRTLFPCRANVKFGREFVRRLSMIATAIP